MKMKYALILAAAVATALPLVSAKQTSDTYHFRGTDDQDDQLVMSRDVDSLVLRDGTTAFDPDLEFKAKP